MTVHAGSNARYNAGCRCDGCRAAHATQWRAYKARRVSTPTPAPATPKPEPRRERVAPMIRRAETDTWPGRP